MVTVSWARQFALSYEEATEQPHFEKTSFRVRKKIFATLNTADKQVVVKFTSEQQSLFGLHNPAAVYPVSGGWGKQGYTVLELSKVRKEVFNDAVTTAYCNVAPKTLAGKYAL
jgi:predicted DNA-binding protein (MmcQ/YjbR family)